MTSRSVRGLLSKLLAVSLYYSGLVPLVRWGRRRMRPRLLILVYHRSSGEPLRRQLRYLRRHYRVLPLEQALEELYGGGDGAGAAGDSRTPLSITFDDGYLDTYLHAAAQARELQVPITVFLVPGYTEAQENFWWYETARLARKARVGAATVAGRTYVLGNPRHRRQLAGALYEVTQRCGSVAERESFLARAREMLDVDRETESQDPGARPVTWGEVGAMREGGWTSFGAHTLHHPVLAHLEDPAELKREVGDSRRLLERRLGDTVRCFAYPLGRAEHIGPDGVRAVRAAGYEWALTTQRGVNSPRTNPYLLRRIGVGGEQDWLVLAAELAGVWPMTAVRKLLRSAPISLRSRDRKMPRARGEAKASLSIEFVNGGR